MFVITKMSFRVNWSSDDRLPRAWSPRSYEPLKARSIFLLTLSACFWEPIPTSHLFSYTTPALASATEYLCRYYYLMPPTSQPISPFHVPFRWAILTIFPSPCRFGPCTHYIFFFEIPVLKTFRWVISLCQVIIVERCPSRQPADF